MNQEKSTAKPKYTKYAEVPWIRKSGTNSVLLILHLLTCGAIPFLLVTCIALVTGNVYYNQVESDGSLKAWSPANKVVAFLLLLPSVLMIGFFGVALIGGLLRSLAG